MIQSKHRFWRDHAVTVGLTVLLLMAVPPVRLGMLDFISGFSRSTNNEKKIREIAAERARRYQPKKQHKLRPSYTESVVYSEGFVELKLDEKKRDEFLALLNDQLFVRRKVSDGNLIKVVSLEGALVKKLSEEAKLIHPDFVKDSLDKMKRIEAEIVIEMHKLLGNEENVREFQRLAAQFYNLNNN